MLYASGHNITSIAEKFGREPQAIRVLMNKMGVKRGSDINDPGTTEARQRIEETMVSKEINQPKRKEVLTLRSIMWAADRF